MFFGGPNCLAVFLKPLFDNFGAKISQNHSVQNGCLGPGLPTNCKKKWLGCLVGALGGFRVLPDAFFVDFGSNLGWILYVFF